MNKTNVFPENLVARARRGELSDNEQSALTEWLAGSATLRASLRLGQDFDQIAAVQTGDETRVSHFVAGALRARVRQRRFMGLLAVRPRPVWLLAAAVLSVCGVALALRHAWHPKAVATAPQNAATSVLSSPAHSLARTPQKSHDSKSPPAVATAPTTPANPVQGEATTSRAAFPAPARIESQIARAPGNGTSGSRGEAVVPSAVPERPSNLTAAALLAQANEARSQGHVDRAITVLAELQQHFPSSPEANVSRVSLGKLYMRKRAHAAALLQFVSYLKQPGSLQEEALVGQAQALAALGRTTEERGTWQLLITLFPSSVYAHKAHQRLAAPTNSSGN